MRFLHAGDEAISPIISGCESEAFAKHTKYAKHRFPDAQSPRNSLRLFALADGFADHLVKRLEDGLKIVF